ncbi:type VI secretion system Vgr family protein [Aquabacterium sp.]|uniref:type VI secretion system Vgr family protein n=1 Tax=Aquabacterium sp. TaxID=1872578 RepID=UPI0035B1CF3D
MTDLSDIRSTAWDAVRDAAGQLLGDLLSSGPTQHNRLLRLHTPLGTDVLLAESARIDERITPDAQQSPFAITLHALSTNAYLQAPELIGKPVLLELLTAHSRTTLRPFHGHVHGFRLLGADGGLARYELIIGSWLDFLRHRSDAWMFQDQSVIDITESVFTDYQGQASLLPAWRWDLKDPNTYPRLSTCSQHHETDFAFLQRLWASHGLFSWFEHEGSPSDPDALGRHTLVIADHNGAFQPNAQPRIRYIQAATVLKEDSIQRWHGQRRLAASTLSTASFDYRSVLNHTGQADAPQEHGQDIPLAHIDQPGAYAFETPAFAQHMADVLMQSLSSQRKRFEGQGTVRTLAPATTFTLADHAEHDADLAAGEVDAACFAVLSVTHHARNNLRADAQAGLAQLLGPSELCAAAARDSLYEARFEAQRAAVPFRPALQDAQGRLLHPKPSAWGTQTAIVVGTGGPVHTDRDGRIKVQFHWQRGTQGSSRLSHPAGDNAPASDASGTWVRVAQSWAGNNWGGVFVPRVGQEVIIAFVEGDIDRPVVVGTLYNGQGSADAQGNVMSGGPATSTANAPAWFPGAQRAGEQEGHAHTATLSGIKTQSLDTAQDGAGNCNQLVFDDTPGQGRVLLHTTEAQTWLQMGHLLQQHDNQRLAPRGHGLELHTLAWGAVRAGSGLHISTHARAHGTASNQGQAMASREAQQQLAQHAELLQSLAANAQTHRAKLPQEAQSISLPAHQALQDTLSSLRGSLSADTHGQSGGGGQIPTTERPDLLLSAAADISSATPRHTVVSAGGQSTITSAQDTQLLSQRHHAWAVKDGISLFTRGEAKNAQRAVQGVGMKLHAASGNVNVQAQSGPFTLTALKTIDLQSTTDCIEISAPDKIVLNGGGSYVRIEGGNIEIGTTGPAEFLAGMKVLTGAGSASGVDPHFTPNSQLFDEQFVLTDEVSGQPIAGAPYRVENNQGKTLTNGITDAQGRTARIRSHQAEGLKVYWGL